jgi:hypothetical protein
MFCVNCGKPYEPSHKFCNYCSYPLPSSGGQREGDSAPDQPIVAVAASVDPSFIEAPVTLSEGPTLVPAPPPLPERAPYAIFVSFALGSALLLSVSVFNVAEALARNRWEATISTVVATVAAALLARSARGAWRRVVGIEPETDVSLRRRHRRVLWNGVVIVLLFFTGAAAVGAAIGQSRAEAIQLAADLEHMSTVGNRISKARSAVEATITSYVQMYKAITPDVEELESTMRRLKTELGVYDRKFPAQHEQTSKSIAGMETGLRRTTLLKQQIDVSKQIDALDPAHQFAAWQTQMLPLLTSEEALDKAK